MITPAWLFQQDAQITRSGTNGRGESYEVMTASTKCRIDSSKAHIKRADGTIVNAKGRGIFPVGTDIAAEDKLVCDGVSYEVESVIPARGLFAIMHLDVVLV